jgi:hypothetical protein
MNTMSNKPTLSDSTRSANEFALSRDNNRALVKATETWFAATVEYQREMMSFMSMRVEKDGETAREILGCRNLADATAIQSRWLEETVRDYNSEMTKLMTIYTKSVEGGGHVGG